MLLSTGSITTEKKYNMLLCTERRRTYKILMLDINGQSANSKTTNSSSKSKLLATLWTTSYRLVYQLRKFQVFEHSSEVKLILLTIYRKVCSLVKMIICCRLMVQLDKNWNQEKALSLKVSLENNSKLRIHSK